MRLNKEEILAYIIMEEAMEPVQAKNVEFFNDNDLFYVRFNATLQDFNVKNRNGRIYLGSAMIPSLNAEHIMELQRNKSWFGEAGHPMSDDIKRILTIDPKLISHKVVSHTVNNYKCTGTIETLDTEYGRQMTKSILQGMNPAFSLRALAPLTKKPDGTAVVETKCHAVCYDWVILPSHKTAYADANAPVQKVIKRLTDDGNVVNESALIPVHESAIKDFISLESSNVKLVSNLCEVALGSMQLSSDMKHVILKEGTNTFLVPLEEKIKHDINNYMRNL